MENQVMSALDSVAGSLASCFVTINGERLNMMQMIDFEAKAKLEKSKVPILGKPGKGNKIVGWSGEWKGTMHYNSSVFRKVMIQYTKTGIIPPMEIQVTNEDKTSSVGRQTVILKDCLLDEALMSKFDADGEYLDEELSGTFDAVEMPEEFTMLDGMK